MRILHLLIAAVVALHCAAQPGALDSSFNGNGRLVLDTVAGNAGALLICQPDGRLVVAYRPAGGQLRIIRLLDDGALDTSFGVAGVSMIGSWNAWNMLVQPDGKIILVTTSWLLRLSAEGAVDSTYGTNGYAPISLPPGSLLNFDAAIQPDGRVLVCGNAHHYAAGYSDAWVMKFTLSGEPDSTFHNDGLLFMAGAPPPGISYSILGIDTWHDGTAVIARGQKINTDSYYNVFVLNSSGSLGMPYYYGSGPGTGTPSNGRPISINGNGDVMHSSFWYSWGAAAESVWHGYRANAPDQFATSHQLFFQPPHTVLNGSLGNGTSDMANNFFFTGQYTTSGASGWDLWRFTPAGILDTGFSGNGHVNTVFHPGYQATPVSICVQPDGKVVVAGWTGTPGGSFPALARYHNIPDPRCRVSARVFLGGAYEANDQLMRDDLRTSGILPVGEPYSSLGYQHRASPAHIMILPGVLDISGDSSVVDWVWLELLSPLDSTLVIAARAALVLRNGWVVDMDGRSPVDMNAGTGIYFLRMRHRNHLGATAAQSVSLGPVPTFIDLTSPATPTFGIDAQKEVSGARALWPGDVNGDGIVRYLGPANDRDHVLTAVGSTTPMATATGYQRADVNLNGSVKYMGAANDRDIILQTIGGTIPTAVRLEQWP